MQSVKLELTGTSPLLMHSFPMAPIEDPPIEKRSPAEQAELAAYREADTRLLYIPGINIQRAMVAAAAYSKGKGRGSLQKPVAACILVSPERISLGVKDYQIDARPVVILVTKGRVIRYRPRLDNWSVVFTLEYDESLITEKQLRNVVDDMGTRVGLLDFRPEKKGPFGRSVVTSWKPTKRG